MNPPIARQLNLDETKLPAEIFERLSRRGATLKDYRAAVKRPSKTSANRGAIRLNWAA